MKSKLRKIFAFSLLLILLAGCQTQQIAEPEVIQPEDVRFYTSTPGNFIVKGTVTATSRPKMTAQETQDYFIQELTRQAANLGANGLVIQYRGAQPRETIRVNRDGRYITVARNIRTVNAQAIYRRRN
jgi:hypothetical protein